MFTKEKRNVMANYEIIKVISGNTDETMADMLGWASRFTKHTRKNKGNWTISELLVLKHIASKFGRKVTIDEIAQKII